MLYSSVDSRMNIRIVHDSFNFHNDVCDIILTLFFGEDHLIDEIVVSFGFKIFKRQILEFDFDFTDTKSLCERSINLHCLFGLLVLFVRRHMFQSSHVMKSVREFNDDNTDILCHNEEHVS